MDVLCTIRPHFDTRSDYLKRHLDIYGEDSDRVLEYAYLNTFPIGLKNLLDVAVLEHHELASTLRPDHQFTKIDEIPFDSTVDDYRSSSDAMTAASPDLQGA